MISSMDKISFVVGRLIPNTVLVVNKDGQMQHQAESAQTDKLEQRDQEVRTHEGAHVRASQGTVIGKPEYEHQVGPDNKPYAIEGRVHVKIKADLSDKDNALRAADTLRRTAKAPVGPSGLDASAALLANEIENLALAADEPGTPAMTEANKQEKVDLQA